MISSDQQDSINNYYIAIYRTLGGLVKIIVLLTTEKKTNIVIPQLKQGEDYRDGNRKYHPKKHLPSIKRRLFHRISKKSNTTKVEACKHSKKSQIWDSNSMAAILALTFKGTSVIKDEFVSNVLAVKMMNNFLEGPPSKNSFVRGCLVYCLACLLFSKQRGNRNIHQGFRCPSIDAFVINACLGDRQFIPTLITVLMNNSCRSSFDYASYLVSRASDHGGDRETDR